MTKIDAGADLDQEVADNIDAYREAIGDEPGVQSTALEQLRAEMPTITPRVYIVVDNLLDPKCRPLLIRAGDRSIKGDHPVVRLFLGLSRLGHPALPYDSAVLKTRAPAQLDLHIDERSGHSTIWSDRVNPAIGLRHILCPYTLPNGATSFLPAPIIEETEDEKLGVTTTADMSREVEIPTEDNRAIILAGDALRSTVRTFRTLSGMVRTSYSEWASCPHGVASNLTEERAPRQARDRLIISASGY